MKKVIMGIVALGLLAGGALQPAYAKGKKVDFSLNIGVMTDLGGGESFSEALFTFSPQADFHVSEHFMVSAEAMVITNDEFRFNPFFLYPGVLLSYTSKGFFVGGGVVLPVIFYEGESDTGDLLPKIHFGYRHKHLNFTAYLLTDTDELFKYNLIGLSVGYLF